MATRVLMIKADGSVLVHSDGGSYKPLNWMSPPCTLREGTTEDGAVEWTVTGLPRRPNDTLRILLEEVLHDSCHDLGVDPGLQKDGVEKHLQELLADHPATLADGLTPGTPRVPDRDRPRRPDVPRRRGPERRRRDQAPRRDRRRRAAHPLPRAAQPRPAPRARSAASSPPRRSSRRPASSPPTAASPAPSSTTTRCAASTTPATGSSDVPVRSSTSPCRSDWEAAQKSGAYTTSTRGRTLAEEGFIHASRGDQWAGRARRASTPTSPSRWCCWSIDTDRLTSPVVEEVPADGMTETFPHIYGPLNTDAVTQAVPLDEQATPRPSRSRRSSSGRCTATSCWDRCCSGWS